MRKVLTLYPSKQHYQRSNDKSVPLAWAIAYLQSLQKAVPQGEQESMLVSWPLVVTYEHTLTDAEVLDERRAELRAALSQIRPGVALTDEQYAQLRALAGSV